MAKDDDILEEARELFEQCEEREADNRDEALDDLEFARLARQWRPEDEEQRAAEGRPCLTINRMPAFIRQVVNDARQNAPSISVRAVDDAADPATAEVMSDLIRDIEAQSSADIAYDTAVDFAVSCGFGYPAQQQQLRNQALGMMPVQQTNTTTTKNNPGFLDYLNTAANVAGAFKGR